MYTCSTGRNHFTKDGVRVSSVVDINIDTTYLLSVFPGNLWIGYT